MAVIDDIGVDILSEKQIQVEYFALFRERVGREQETVRTMAATASELFAERQAQHDALESLQQMKVAINDQLCTWDAAIGDGDRVLFFPPVAGG